ncbi:Transposon Tf2-1 polyprotein [Sparassis crispa]|uniref:Transposon Tf2-1 polyprotein n=1 Tax=Sparassis crispa TaxID=139825 RepID=A0A401GAH9_9APHY|nr:Transposon Tf2-1 polyprotein [Sparassis crispa]GBE79178.1 Transposon Tf2-1 polyprotein [Sparassis crispa]
MADVESARRAKGKENAKPRANVAAVSESVDDITFNVGTINVNSTLLTATTGILGTGSDSEPEYIQPPLAPFTVAHIPWSGIVHGPRLDSDPLPMLIDSSSPAVLIRSELISCLGLRHCKLPQPFLLGDVWGMESKDSVEWVKLRVSSPDLSWSSVTCRAIIVSLCCYPIIAGRPFLKTNRLIVDHKCDSITDKSTGHDICKLAPLAVSPPPSLAPSIIPVAFLFHELAERTADCQTHCDEHTVDEAATAVHAIRKHTEELAFQMTLESENRKIKDEFSDLFPDDIPHLNELPTDIYHHFVLKDPSMFIQHSDPTALLRWVNDYRALNANTVPDMHPLPLISDILADCAKGKIWGKIDMTNSFFQTHVHPDDIAGMRPLCTNDGCLTLEEHIHNMCTVLEALRAHHLYCSDKKTSLFLTELSFLGHIISQDGIQPDPQKVEKILNWSMPHSTSQVRAFLGLVCYIALFLPKLTDFTHLLNPLTTKDAELNFPTWMDSRQAAFDSIKMLVCSREVLTSIDHDNMGNNKIFVSCDASDFCTGALLSYSESLETAHPVAFESCTLKGAELNYPVHEKELLVIVHALKKWCVNLLGVPFTIYTDHRTLENFFHQKELSRRQAHWQEFLVQYDFDIRNIKGEENITADILSCIPADTIIIDPSACVAVSLIHIATRSLCDIPESIAVFASAASRLSIAADPVYAPHLDPSVFVNRMDSFTLATGLSFPQVPKLCEAIFCLAHDSLGHFGFDKSYAAIRDTYYWPNMHTELEHMYVPVSLADDALNEATRAAELFTHLDMDVMEAQDNLFLAKVNQAALANHLHSEEISYVVGDKVMLSTFHRHCDYMQHGDNRVAKFMVHYDGPYSILHSYPEFSAYTLDLPTSTNIFPTFHSSLLKPWLENDPELFPSHQCSQPGPIITTDGVEEWEVESIVDHRPRGHGFQYLVRFRGYGPEHDVWLPR